MIRSVIGAVLFGLFSAGFLQAQEPTIIQINLDDVIHPVSAEYVRAGLALAGETRARAVILRINTPGGLVNSMQDIVKAVLASPVPVITWVGPNGARAASAGFFILLSGDVAVMAPGTDTGAAHPVTSSGGALEPVMEKKVVSDAAAYLRSYVTRRERNAAAAESAVTESRSFTAQEAVQEKLIDGLANDADDIIRRFDDHEVRRVDDSLARLHLKGARIQLFEMTSRQRVLSAVLDPNLAFVLALIGILGIYMEMSHPGLILPGVAGSICFILGLFAFNLLPISWAGVLLIVLAIVLFVLEAAIVSHGILGLGGAVAMIAGGLMLVDGPIPQLRIHLITVLAVTVPMALITIFLVRLAFVAKRRKAFTGDQAMIGEIGLAKSDIFKEGRVLVHGEDWSASSALPIAAGAAVRVTGVKGLKVEVENAASDNGRLDMEE